MTAYSLMIIIGFVPKLSPENLAALRLLPLEAGKNNKLRHAMALARVPQVQVERATRLPKPYVSDIARGHIKDVGVSRARKLAEYLGCLIEDIFPRVVLMPRTHPAPQPEVPRG